MDSRGNLPGIPAVTSAVTSAVTTVLLSGAADPWSSALARFLASRDSLRVLALSAQPPDVLLGNATLLPLPASGGELADLLAHERVDVVISAAIVGEQAAADREAAKQANVLTTSQLLGACLRARVRQVIMRSSTLVYGTRHNNPAFIGEDQALATQFGSPWLHDIADAERLAAAFAATQPRPTITVLRLPAVLGAGLSTPLGDLLASPSPLRPIGFDPRVQILSGHDALAAFAQAIEQPIAGAVNIAAPNPLPLSRALRLAAPALPTTLNSLARSLVQALRGREVHGLDTHSLRFSCVADTTRMREAFGFNPSLNAEETLVAFRHEQDARSAAPLQWTQFADIQPE